MGRRLLIGLLISVALFVFGCGKLWGTVSFANNNFSTVWLFPGVLQYQAFGTISTVSPAAIPVTATGSGNLLVVGFVGPIANQISGISDTLNTYSLAVRSTDPAGGTESEIWYAKNSVAGATSVQVSWVGGQNGQMWFMEVYGMDQNNPLDQAIAFDNSSPTATVNPTPITTSLPNEFVFSVLCAADTVSQVDPSSPFNQLPILIGNDAAYYLYGNSVGSRAVIWDQLYFPDRAAVATAAFKPALQTGTYTPPAKLGFATVPQTVNAYTCSNPTSVGLHTSTGTLTATAADTIVNLSGGGFTFYSDPICSVPISTVTIPEGFSSANFYFEGTATGGLGVSAAGLTAGSQTETINTNILGNNWTVVAENNVNGINVVETTQTFPFAQATKAGDLLVAYCGVASVGTILNVTDNAPAGGNTYVPSNSGNLLYGTGTHTAEAFYVLNSKAGATALTITSTVGGVELACGMTEFNNSAGVSLGEEPLVGPTHGDNSATGTTVGVNQVITTQITTGTAGDLILGMIWDFQGCGVQTPGAGFTAVDSCMRLEARSQGIAGIINSTATIAPAGDQYFIEGLSFKP